MRVIRWLNRAFWLGAIVLVLTVMAVQWQTREAWRADGEGAGLEQSNAVGLVLGSTVRGDEMLDYAGRRRVRLGVQLLEEGKVGQLLMAGGQVRQGPWRAADYMAKFAISLGAPSEALLTERESRTTFENMLYSKALLDAGGSVEVVIITDAYHMPRAAMLAETVGLSVFGRATVTGPPGLGGELGMLPIYREAVAWWVNIVRVAWWRLRGRAWP